MQTKLLFFLTWAIYTGVLSLILFLRLQTLSGLLLQLAGSLIGLLLPLFIDVLLPRIQDGSAKPDITVAKDVLKQGTNTVLSGSIYHEGQEGSLLRSYPLLLGYFIAAFFVITSTQNWFGRGFVLGLGLFLVTDLYLSKNPETLRKRWFSVFHTRLNDTELKYFVFASIGTFGILTLFSVLM